MSIRLRSSLGSPARLSLAEPGAGLRATWLMAVVTSRTSSFRSSVERAVRGLIWMPMRPVSGRVRKTKQRSAKRRTVS